MTAEGLVGTRSSPSPSPNPLSSATNGPATGRCPSRHSKAASSPATGADDPRPKEHPMTLAQLLALLDLCRVHPIRTLEQPATFTTPVGMESW